MPGSCPGVRQAQSQGHSQVCVNWDEQTSRQMDSWVGGSPPLPQRRNLEAGAARLRGLVILDWAWGWARSLEKEAAEAGGAGRPPRKPGDGPEGAVPFALPGLVRSSSCSEGGSRQSKGDQGACAEGRPWAGRPGGPAHPRGRQ